MTTYTLDDLTPEQADRIESFAWDHGRSWKRELNDMWLCGKDANQRDGHLLRQVRNQQGPSWLNKMQLKRKTT